MSQLEQEQESAQTSQPEPDQKDSSNGQLWGLVNNLLNWIKEDRKSDLPGNAAQYKEFVDSLYEKTQEPPTSTSEMSSTKPEQESPQSEPQNSDPVDLKDFVSRLEAIRDSLVSDDNKTTTVIPAIPEFPSAKDSPARSSATEYERYMQLAAVNPRDAAKYYAGNRDKIFKQYLDKEKVFFDVVEG